MKKIVVMVLLAVVAASSVFGATKTIKVDKTNYQAAQNYIFDRDITKGEDPTVAGPTFFQDGGNGYGWFTPHNAKIAYDYSTNTFGAIYRQDHSAGPGTVGIHYGSYGDNTFEDTEVLHTPSGTEWLGARYPYTVVQNGIYIGICTEAYNDLDATKSRMMLNVYDPDSGDIADVKVIDGNGNAFGGWLNVSDITFNEETGEYVLAIVAQYGLSSTTDTEYGIIIAKTIDPLDADSWSFSDYNDLYFVEGENSANPEEFAFYFCDETPKVTWGKDGFGIVCAIIGDKYDPDDIKTYPGWIYTTNYGETWTTAEGNKFFTPDYDAWVNSFDIIGEPLPGGESVYTDFFTKTESEPILDSNGKLHWIIKGHGTDAEGYTNAMSDDGMFNDGIYHVLCDLNTEDGSMTFETSPIANTAGWTSEAFGEFRFMFRHRNIDNMSVGLSEDGGVYAAWVDRGLTDNDTEISDFIGSNDVFHNFKKDVYFSYSEDNGQTWSVIEDENGLLSGHNLTATKSKNEEGFDLLKIARDSNAKGDLKIYSVWQEADLSQPISQGAPEQYNDHKQKYYLAAIDVADFSSDVEEIAPNSISLEQNYPNPFNPTTAINYSVDATASVNLTVFNTAGEQVAELVNGSVAAGNHSVQFDGSNLNSGVYFYKLSVNGISNTKKMVLTK